MSGVIPLTGVPLPFVSYGGSSLLANLLAMGILLNIASHVKRQEKQQNGLMKKRTKWTTSCSCKIKTHCALEHDVFYLNSLNMMY